MNNEVFKKRVEADKMRLEYRSELARNSEENVTYKILLAYSDIISDFMFDGRTFNYSFIEVQEYITSMASAMVDEMNTCRGITTEEYIDEKIENLIQQLPDDIKAKFDELPDNPLYNEDNSWLDDTDYDEEDDEDEE